MLRTILLASAAIAITPAAAQSFDSAAVSGLGIRNIGSATMSGRIAAVAGRQEADGKVTLLIGSASGGVWKSEDGGTTFKPVFDKQSVQSIGAVAMDPTNKEVMWVGSGEAWTRNSVSVGNGVYKSTDGGETWTNVGLPGTERIDRIIVHPKNGNIVYVCAPGPLWSDSADRGLYKTTDGGKTWSLVLKGTNLSTGCSSVAMDPANPDHLLAGTWDFRRRPFEYRSGGNGPDQIVDNTNPAVRLGAKVFFVECNGREIPGSEGATDAQIGCRVLFDVTPKDAQNAHTRVHETPRWTFSPSGIAGGIDGRVEFTATVPATGEGTLTAYCQADGLRSNDGRITFHR
jgi:hypothetical protein